ncbi:Uncharacterised protein [Streptococcus pneumoniae]|nr:Uncharacterised protein [Streptococcus pneumoniae]
MKSELRKQVLHEMKALSQEQKTGYRPSFNRANFTTPLLSRSQGHRNLPLFFS